MTLDSSPDNKIQIGGKKYLYFGGTAYLGLPNDTDFKDIIIKNIKKWGTSYGSSRMANISLSCYENAENYLSKFIGSESSLTVSSGMLAGKIAVDVLKKSTDVFYHFDGNHEAIQVAKSLPFYENNKLNERLLDAHSEDITILTDGVISGAVTAFRDKILNEISTTKNITILIDESHSFGILGTNGNGIFSTINHPKIKRKILVSSLGKAFGITGGIIAGDKNIIDQAKLNPIYGSSAGMNPGFAQSICEAQIIFLNKLKNLKNNLSYIDSHLKKRIEIIFSKNYPLIYTTIDGIYEKFLEKNIVITNFKYPTSDKNLNRIVVTANHTIEDLDEMIAVLNQ